MTDYYKTVETALVTRLRTLTSHFANSWQVSVADERALDKGAEEFALVYPGGFPNAQNDVNNKLVDWEVQVDLMVRFKDYATTFATLMTLRSDVLNLLMDDRNLSRTAGVMDVIITAEERPQSVYKAGANEGSQPVFIAQRLLVTVRAIVGF